MKRRFKEDKERREMKALAFVAVLVIISLILFL